MSIRVMDRTAANNMAPDTGSGMTAPTTTASAGSTAGCGDAIYDRGLCYRKNQHRGQSQRSIGTAVAPAYSLTLGVC